MTQRETKGISGAIIGSGAVRRSTIVQNEKNELRQYLLGQLQEADEERLELRLLMDAAYAEEFDIIVDEITDQYLAGEFQGEELDGVERYFLRATDRRNKLNFAS